MLVMDAYAWIEYFSGSERGEKVKAFIESEEMLVTPAMALFEIKNKLVREKKPWREAAEFVCSRSVIEPLDKETALSAAEIKYEYGLGAADAIIYATAIAKKSKLVTGDAHFKKLPHIEFI